MFEVQHQVGLLPAAERARGKVRPLLQRDRVDAVALGPPALAQLLDAAAQKQPQVATGEGGCLLIKLYSQNRQRAGCGQRATAWRGDAL